MRPEGGGEPINVSSVHRPGSGPDLSLMLSRVDDKTYKTADRQDVVPSPHLLRAETYPCAEASYNEGEGGKEVYEVVDHAAKALRLDGGYRIRGCLQTSALLN